MLIILGFFIIPKLSGKIIFLPNRYFCEGNNLSYRYNNESSKMIFDCSIWSSQGCSEGLCMPDLVDNKTSSPLCTKIPGWVCIGKYRGYQTADCEFKSPELCENSCINGVCTIYVCDDSDGGKFFLKKGLCKDNRGNSHMDSCVPNEPTKLNEAYCEDKSLCKIEVFDNACEKGCENGACKI